PRGRFRLENRGRHFFSERYGQGAYCWVRFQGNYLFHSVPIDRDGEILADEREKLGLPASHGCVRLDMADAEWFYETVPDGSLVLIR
ncbi:MAG: L,D-transpeptidase family protein, partial [Thermaerobacterales bacterium]